MLGQAPFGKWGEMQSIEFKSSAGDLQERSLFDHTHGYRELMVRILTTRLKELLRPGSASEERSRALDIFSAAWLTTYGVGFAKSDEGSIATCCSFGDMRQLFSERSQEVQEPLPDHDMSVRKFWAEALCEQFYNALDAIASKIVADSGAVSGAGTALEWKRTINRILDTRGFNEQHLLRARNEVISNTSVAAQCRRMKSLFKIEVHRSWGHLRQYSEPRCLRARELLPTNCRVKRPAEIFILSPLTCRAALVASVRLSCDQARGVSPNPAP